VVIEQTTVPLQKLFTRSIDKEEVIDSIERNTNGDFLGFNYASRVASDFIIGVYMVPMIWLYIPLYCAFILVMVSSSLGRRCPPIVVCRSQTPSEGRALVRKSAPSCSKLIKKLGWALL
jgi:hypothetical protein